MAIDSISAVAAGFLGCPCDPEVVVSVLAACSVNQGPLRCGLRWRSEAGLGGRLLSQTRAALAARALLLSEEAGCPLLGERPVAARRCRLLGACRWRGQA